MPITNLLLSSCCIWVGHKIPEHCSYHIFCCQDIKVKILLCRWRSALLWRAFFTAATVAILLRALIDVCLSGKCGLFGKGGLIMFDAYSENVSYHLQDLPPVLLLGVVGGILGSLYNFLLDKVLRVYNLIHE